MAHKQQLLVRLLAFGIVLAGPAAFAQRPSDPALLVPQTAPPLDYVAVANPMPVPADIKMGAAASVAFDSKGHLLVLSRGAQPLTEFDADGKFAALGKADEAWIARALELPFFASPPPKSLDRNDFAALKLGDVPPADGAATLTAFTAAAIARIVPLLPRRPRSWIVCGGGARNRTMLQMVRERVGSATVEAAETVGWASDAIEAQAFGFLAARGLKGLPLSYPATTGVPMPMTGGVIARP